MSKRRKVSHEFKVEAVKLVTEQRLSVWAGIVTKALRLSSISKKTG